MFLSDSGLFLFHSFEQARPLGNLAIFLQLCPLNPIFRVFFLPAKSVEVSLLRVRGSKYRDGDIRLKGVILYVGGH